MRLVIDIEDIVEVPSDGDYLDVNLYPRPGFYIVKMGNVKYLVNVQGYISGPIEIPYLPDEYNEVSKQGKLDESFVLSLVAVMTKPDIIKDLRGGK